MYLVSLMMTRHRTVCTMASAIAALLLLPPVVSAQDLSPTNPGFSVQLFGVAGSMKTQIYPQAAGASALGAGGDITYGASPQLGLFGRVTRLSSSSATLNESTDYTVLQGDVGARWTTLPGKRVRPFAEAGLAMRQLAFTFADTEPLDFQATNVGITVSVGLMIFRTDRVSLEGAGTYSSGNFSTWKVNGQRQPLQQLQSETMGVRLGARYWFTK